MSVCLCYVLVCTSILFFFFKQKTAYEVRISDWSSDVCSSDLIHDLEKRDGACSRYGNVIERHGRVDVAVHNVGGTIWAKPFWDYCAEEIEAEINRSLWPTIWCCHAVLPHLLAAGQGAIVNRSEEHTSELQSHMRISYAVFC